MPHLDISIDVSDIARAIKREQLPDPVNRRHYNGTDQFGNQYRVQLDIGLRADTEVCLVMRNISVIGFVGSIQQGMLLAYDESGEDKCQWRDCFSNGVATLGATPEENMICAAAQYGYRLELHLMPEVSKKELEQRATQAA